MTWPRLWAVARHDLRLSEREWQTMWACDLLALFGRFRYGQMWWSWRFAVLLCASGVRRSESGPLLTPMDVMKDFFND